MGVYEEERMKQEKKWKMVSRVRVVELIYPISSHPGTRDTSANLTIKKMCRNADMRRGPDRAIGHGQHREAVLIAHCSLPLLEWVCGKALGLPSQPTCIIFNRQVEPPSPLVRVLLVVLF